ncbi:MAG TPA: serine hydrolase domain-containing protein [Acidimicrobiales bacterium]|nr:serine hydrolase domain-containing protein [Acidimicrobiales bacterium]
MAGAGRHPHHRRGVTPLSALALPATLVAVRQGAQEGLHVGAQLAVAFAGQVTLLVDGIAAPGRPMEEGTLLPWFSATKPITAVAVLQQWERGRLDPDDPVARHVPEFAAAGKERVTIRHLLTHTARLAAPPPAGDGWDELLAAACASPLADGWGPGRRAAYSPRLGFHVLGEVVRRIDGRAYETYVHEEVFEPLGMADSWIVLPPERFAAYGDRMGAMHDTSRGEARVIAGLARPEGFTRPRPSGSGVGPAGDLVRLYLALLGKGELDGVRILSPQTVDTMCARHRAGLRDETFGAVMDWGLGVIVNSWHYEGRPAPYGFGEHASMRAFGHGGQQSSVSFADPDAGLAAAVVFNGMAGERGHHRRTQPVLSALYEDLGLVRA